MLKADDLRRDTHDEPEHPVSMHELSSLLWTERELLESLLFRLDHERLLLASGDTRWLGRVADEISATNRKLQTVGLARMVESEAVAKDAALAEGATLADLAESAKGEVWGTILEAHLDAMRTVITEIAALRDGNERLVRAASIATQEALAELGSGVAVYADVDRATAGRLVDREA